MLAFYLFPKRILISLLTLSLFFSILFRKVHLFLLIAFALFFLFRRKKTKTDPKWGQVYSPVHGIVRSISRVENHFFLKGNFNIVQIIVPHFFQMQINIPLKCEIDDAQNFDGPYLLRYAPVSFDFTKEANAAGFKSEFLSLRSNFDFSIGLQFTECALGASPHLWAKPGDIAHFNALCGVFPFGGTVLVYVPDSLNVLVRPGELLFPSKTVIAEKKD